MQGVTPLALWRVIIWLSLVTSCLSPFVPRSRVFAQGPQTVELSKGIDLYGSKVDKVYDARLALDPDRKELTIAPKEGGQQGTVTVSYSEVVKLTYEFDRHSRWLLSDETKRWLRIDFQKDTEEEDSLYLRLNKDEYYKIIPAVVDALGKELFAAFNNNSRALSKSPFL